jgi:hypothetical protein
VSFPPVHLLLEFVEDVPAGTTVSIDGSQPRAILQGRRCREFAVEPGSHAIVVSAGKRVFRKTVVADSHKSVVTVDLGSEPAPTIAASQQKPAPRAKKQPRVRVYEPSEVWLAGLRLRKPRIRVAGLARVYSLRDERYLLRFQDGRTLVNCLVDADSIGPMKGKVEHGDYRVVLLEAEVQRSGDGVVTMGNGQVIWGVPPSSK